MAEEDTGRRGKSPMDDFTDTSEQDDRMHDGFRHELLDRKIPVLPRFPSDRVLLGQRNYGILRVLMESVLETHDILYMVAAEYPRPDATSLRSILWSPARLQKEQNLWDQLNARIRSFLFLNCSPAVIEHIKHMQGAREILLRLEGMYHRMTPMKRVSIEVSMRNLKPANGSSITEHINTLQSMQQEVLAAGKIISSEDMAITLLSHLPKSYSSFYSSLITSGRANTILWEELVPMVIDEEENQKRYGGSSGKSEAFAGQQSQGAKKKQQQGRQGPQQQQKQSRQGGKKASTSGKEKEEWKCYICDKTDHIAKDCPEKKKAGSSSIASAFVHQVELDDAVPSSSSEVGMSTAPRSSWTWVVDSGASHHMTPLSDGLENLRHRHGEVTVVDSSNTPIHGIGDMQLISDGRGGFHNSHVLYVPGLGFHLLSVSQLCKLGLTVDFSANHFWIRDKDSRAVVCEGREDNGLYKLRDTQTLSLYTTPASISQSWHARFGHLNYDYLRRAFKDGLVTGLPEIESPQGDPQPSSPLPPMLGDSDGSGPSDIFRHQQVPVLPPLASKDAPFIDTGRDLADEEADLPLQEIVEEISSERFPTWARQTMRDSGIEGAPPEWEATDGPRRSHRIQQQSYSRVALTTGDPVGVMVMVGVVGCMAVWRLVVAVEKLPSPLTLPQLGFQPLVAHSMLGF
ncbi:hypothetical protein L7F22_014179 [Adiantum nelumboides]|nr:hypothetical protein [Adiantum nelumboides]